MSPRIRAAAACGALAASVLGLSACGEVPANAYGPGKTTVVLHKEYIPASMVTRTSCSGGVPDSCGDEKVLEKQCWRIDVADRYDIADPKWRAKYAKEHSGRTYTQANPRSVCVFPSEFDKITVGDTYTPGTVAY